MTTREDIRGWFNQQKELGYDYMIVVCDPFDYEDYPVGVKRENFWEKYRSYAKAMEVMEVYDLNADIEPQLQAHRAFNMPPRED